MRGRLEVTNIRLGHLEELARVAARLNHVDQARREQFVTVANHVADKLAGVKSFDGDENSALAEVIQSSAIAPAPGGKH